MYDRYNVFAKIIRKEIPCNVVYEDDKIMAFHDISAAAPVHVLVVPKGEYISFDDFSAIAGTEEIGNFFARVRDIANNLDVAKSGYRILTNHGNDASQTVAHFHVHILGGKKLGGLTGE
jgi:diadenosine tetraphosphate (Ap4A) HIT family hydrolase